MELKILLQNYYDVSYLPMEIFSDGILVERISPTVFAPNPALFYIKPLLQYGMCESMDLTISKDGVICGYIRDIQSGHLVVFGPMLEYSCTYNVAHNIVKDMGEPSKRANDFLQNFETIPCITLTKFFKHLLFLHYAINNIQPPKAFTHEKLISLVGPELNGQSKQQPHDPTALRLSTQLLSSIEHGKVDELKELLQSSNLLNGDTNMAANDSLRSLKNLFIISAAHASHAATQGGLPLDTAIFAMDRYLQNMERMNDYQEISLLWRQMLIDFSTKVKKILRTSGFSKLVHMASAYVYDHIYEKIQVAEIAQTLDYNRTYLCSTFKRETGENLTDFIQKAKIDEAKYLLQTTNKTIIEIAVELGFSSQNYFQVVFKKTEGVTPSQYRTSS